MKDHPIEPIAVALFERLNALVTSGDLKMASRQLQHVAEVDIALMPCAFQHQLKLPLSDVMKGVRIQRASFMLDWYFYAPASQSAPGSTILNTLVDKALAQLAPPMYDGKQTLGGLVEDCYVEGAIEYFEGVLQDRAVVILPVKIVVSGQ